jgi:hypothetical protein
LAIDHNNVAGAMDGRTDREHLKAAAKERMRRVSDLDLRQIVVFWVLEGGIKVSGRSTI